MSLAVDPNESEPIQPYEQGDDEPFPDIETNDEGQLAVDPYDNDFPTIDTNDLGMKTLIQDDPFPEINTNDWGDESANDE